MNIPSIFWIVPAASVVALSFAWAFYRLMKREDEGTPRMREIAAHVRKGAMAYLRQQYKVVGIVFAVLALFCTLQAERDNASWLPAPRAARNKDAVQPGSPLA